MIDGVRTTYGWMVQLQFVGLIALYGAAAGLLFWLIAAAGAQQSEAREWLRHGGSPSASICQHPHPARVPIAQDVEDRQKLSSNSARLDSRIGSVGEVFE